MISADTNLFLYSANPACPQHVSAKAFFDALPKQGFVVCELVLIEIYMQLRNPAVLRRPFSAKVAAGFCDQLRSNPNWQWIDYHADVSKKLWHWASTTGSSFRRIIDARLAFTLLHHGVTEFATANVTEFKSFQFDKVWNPVSHP